MPASRGRRTTPTASSRLEALRALVPAVIAKARETVAGEREAKLKELRVRVRGEARRVAGWTERSLAVVGAKRWRVEEKQGRVSVLLEKRLRLEEESIRGAGLNHAEWLKKIQVAGAPYLRLVAVFSGE